MTDKNTIQKAHNYLVSQLEKKHGLREAKAMARIVFEDLFAVFNFSRQDHLSLQQMEQLEETIQALSRDEPIQYILGKADFYGLSLKVNPAVLIPRPETEELVYWILESIPTDFSSPSLDLLDIGTGSACIAISLKHKCSSLNVQAIDISEEALVLAAENADLHQCEIDFQCFDILEKERWNEFAALDIIVSNPPYIPFHEKDKMTKQVLDFEPALALFVANNDPLIFYRNIAIFAKQKLRKGGQLYFETNEYNAEKLRNLLQLQGFEKIELRKDMSGKDRMIKASV